MITLDAHTPVRFIGGTYIEYGADGQRTRHSMIGWEGEIVQRLTGKMDAECKEWVEHIERRPRNFDQMGNYLVRTRNGLVVLAEPTEFLVEETCTEAKVTAA